MANLLLITAVVLFLASPAWASCGWVMWREVHKPAGYYNSTIMEGFESKAECLAAVPGATARYGVFMKTRPKVVSVRTEQDAVWVTREGSTETDDYYFRCLPAGANLLMR